MSREIIRPDALGIEAITPSSAFMAKVFQPAGSERALGSVGQVVFSECKAGATARQRVNPYQPRTAEQLAVRSSMTTVSRAWASLSDANRLAWRAYAAAHPVSNAFGQQVTLSGYNWFCRLTRNLAEAGIAQVDTAPTTSAPAGIASFQAANGVLSSSLSWTATGLSAFKIGVAVYGPHSAGIAPKLAMANLNGYFPAETSPKVISSLSAGLYTFYAWLLEEASGLVGPVVTDDATITAT
jgi:hypothetical protein